MCLGRIQAAFQRTVKSVWKREFGCLEVEDDRVAVGHLDARDVDRERRAPAHARMIDLGLDGVGHVVGGELDAVAPVDALAELDRHLGEVVVVDRRLGGERILPGVGAAFGVDPPERVGRELLVAVDVGAAARRPRG